MNKKEALFYEKLDKKRVRCYLCPWECIVLPNKVGKCGVRQNKGGKFYSLIYGVVSSLALDPIEKKPLFHFHPGSQVLSIGTYGCNMLCGHCQNWQISHADYSKAVLSERIILPQQLIESALEKRAQGIAWTYNEPSIWFEYTLESARLAKQNNLFTVYVTNGYINKLALNDIGPYLDAFRVDIKGFSEDTYKKLCKIPHYQRILEVAEHAKKMWNMHVEVVTNIVPTVNDDDKQLMGIAYWIKKYLGEDTPWHVTRFMPYLDYKDLSPTPVATLEKARQIGMEAGLHYIYIGNVPGHTGENTYCFNCKRLIVERIGYNITKNHISSGKCGFCSKPIMSFRE
ncbi:AmmeMemoRadiSam system radical SAM enzyme [Candidatus Margulisiibacteriota bacterium]